MLIARNEKNQLVNLLEVDVSELNGQFRCPACQASVRLKRGNIKRPHFAHVSLVNCASWSENESAQHLQLKEALYRWIGRTDQVEMEKYLPELNQTPDLLVNGKIALEVQCSPLSLERLRERTENYRRWGYKVIWLLGKDLWLKASLTALQKNFLYFSENCGFYCWELDLERRVVRLKHLIYQNLRGKLAYLVKEYGFGAGKFLELLRRPYAGQKLQFLAVQNDRNLDLYFMRQLRSRSRHWLRLQMELYQQGRNLLTESFELQWAPPGLELITGKEDQSFCQITRNLRNYYSDFQKYYQDGPQAKLYPPRFYVSARDL